MVGTGATALMILTGTAFWSVLTPRQCSGLTFFMHWLWAGQSWLHDQKALLTSHFFWLAATLSVYVSQVRFRIQVFNPKLTTFNAYRWRFFCFRTRQHESHQLVWTFETGEFAYTLIARVVSIRPISCTLVLHSVGDKQDTKCVLKRRVI